MPARSAPGSLAMARKINYGKNFIRHGWLLIGELELCDKLLGCQLVSSQSDDVFKPPQLADPNRRGVVAFTVAAFLRRSGDELAVRSGREPLVREAPAQLAGATRRWR